MIGSHRRAFNGAALAAVLAFAGGNLEQSLPRRKPDRVFRPSDAKALYRAEAKRRRKAIRRAWEDVRREAGRFRSRRAIEARATAAWKGARPSFRSVTFQVRGLPPMTAESAELVRIREDGRE